MSAQEDLNGTVLIASLPAPQVKPLQTEPVNAQLAHTWLMELASQILPVKAEVPGMEKLVFLFPALLDPTGMELHARLNPPLVLLALIGMVSSVRPSLTHALQEHPGMDSDASLTQLSARSVTIGTITVVSHFQADAQLK